MLTRCRSPRTREGLGCARYFGSPEVPASARALSECDLLQELSWTGDYRQPEIDAYPAEDGARCALLRRWTAERAGLAPDVLCAVSVCVFGSLRLEDIVDRIWGEFKGEGGQNSAGAGESGESGGVGNIGN